VGGADVPLFGMSAPHPKGAYIPTNIVVPYVPPALVVILSEAKDLCISRCEERKKTTAGILRPTYRGSE
jgi:hypothetical protein